MKRSLTFWPNVMLPGLEWFGAHCSVPCDRRSNVLMTGISGQEADWKSRVQFHGGPAHGLWQFERGGAVRGVLTHPASKAHALACCAAAGVNPTEADVWQALASIAYDHLAFAFARLLLWTDPRPLPAVTDVHNSWLYYDRNWNPGRPRPEDWPDNIGAALLMVPHDDP